MSWLGHLEKGVGNVGGLHQTMLPTEPVECWGPRASEAAHQLLDGQKVELRFDPSQGQRDAYDRQAETTQATRTG